MNDITLLGGLRQVAEALRAAGQRFALVGGKPNGRCKRATGSRIALEDDIYRAKALRSLLERAGTRSRGILVAHFVLGRAAICILYALGPGGRAAYLRLVNT